MDEVGVLMRHVVVLLYSAFWQEVKYNSRTEVWQIPGRVPQGFCSD